MKLIVGLGNPGIKYKNTRHNLGRQVTAHLAVDLNFPKMTFKKSLFSLLTGKNINGQKIIIVWPETFMNLSGRAILALKNFYKLTAQEIWLVYDDLALPLGHLRIRKKGSAGGHKGVQSIIEALKTKELVRFRLGIKPLEHHKIYRAEKFVLQNFTKSEKSIIQPAVKKCAQAIDCALKFGIEAAMNNMHVRNLEIMAKLLNG